MHTISTNKLDAAKAQLVQAILNLFQGGDLIAVHALASGARQILNDLCIASNISRDIEDSEEYKSLSKPIQNEISKRTRAPQNFIKHADKDPDQSITFNPKLTELIIHDACQLYRSLTSSLFHEGTVYQAWMYKKYPNDFGGINKLNEIFPNITLMPDPENIKEYLRLANIKR